MFCLRLYFIIIALVNIFDRRVNLNRILNMLLFFAMIFDKKMISMIKKKQYYQVILPEKFNMKKWFFKYRIFFFCFSSNKLLALFNPRLLYRNICQSSISKGKGGIQTNLITFSISLYFYD